MAGSFLEDLYRNVGNFTKTVNNNTYGAVARASGEVTRSLGDIPARIAQAVNPNDDESRGNTLINQANTRYGFTPQFKSQLDRANPVVTNNNPKTSGLKGAAAIGTQTNNRLNRIIVGSSDDRQRTLRHEGLHDSYSSLKDQQKNNFYDLADRAERDLPNIYSNPDNTGKVVRTGLTNYLNGKLANYSDYQGNASNVRQQPASLQNEVHSYIPDYFDATQQVMPSYLKDYYANYYNTGGKASGLQQKNELELLLGRIFQ